MAVNISPQVITIEVAQRGLPGFNQRSAQYSTNLPLSALRAVSTIPGPANTTLLVYTQPTLEGSFVGISTTAGPGLVTVVNGDWVTDPNWNWRVGPVFCEVDGLLTQDPVTAWKEVAYASYPTSLFVRRGITVNG